ncbi:hypothetical protein B0T18DRAFT_488693 [Schizothecium vesticola]|uniref:Uncharacterized protein n=1 Tax=Schizothecium vesticola TaxID=314040 RepID=A0AA40EV00_9PEZI|nr:hypothetical protein B0T18DRAFT_488693 [Schizothecium vesticola]
MASQLAGLPVDIMFELCAHLCTHCQEAYISRPAPHIHPAERKEIRLRRSALAALSRASKSLREIATPYLYHFIYHQREDRGTTLPSLIRTVTSRPDLARHIKHIEVDHTNFCTLSEEIAEQLSHAATERNLPLLPKWSTHLYRRPLVLLELLLLHSPNANTIHLLMTHGTTFSDLAVLSETAGGFNLPALTTLSASRHPTASSHPTDESQEGLYFRFRHSFPLFYAAVAAPKQGLRTLSLRRACDIISNFVPTPQGLNPLATVTSLTLDSCRITLEQAADLITACDSLEIFHMLFFHTITSHPEADVKDSRVVLDAIRKHTATLRVLSLDNSRDPLVRSVEDVETLKGFAKLESLFVGLTMLGGEDRFVSLWDDEETGRRAMQGDGFLAGMLPASFSSARGHLDSEGRVSALAAADEFADI